MQATISIASEAQAAEILALYRPFVNGTIVSFELAAPGLDEMRQRITTNLKKWPWLVCELDGQLAGYVYATKHRDRAAYQWAVDVSAYVHPQYQRAGIGRALYISLFSLLRLQGFYNAYAGIALPNPASVGLHEAVGFRQVGIYRQVGYKLGGWHDVGWWQRQLQPPAGQPLTPLDFNDLPASAARQAALEAGLPLLSR